MAGLWVYFAQGICRFFLMGSHGGRNLQDFVGVMSARIIFHAAAPPISLLTLTLGKNPSVDLKR